MLCSVAYMCVCVCVSVCVFLVSFGEGIGSHLFFLLFAFSSSYRFLRCFRYTSRLYTCMYIFPSVQEDVAARLTNAPRVNRQ